MTKRALVVAVIMAMIIGGRGLGYAQSDDFRFARGDAVRIVVWENPGMSGDFEIMADGRIAHPLLQNVPVVGRPFLDVHGDIVTYLEQFQKTPLVVVTPLVRISVGGAVHQPKIVSIDPRAKLLELIGHAGGPTAQAKLDFIEVVRDGKRSRLRPWESAVASQSLHQLDLGSGDLVVVPERRSTFRDGIVPVATFLGSLVGVASLILQVTE